MLNNLINTITDLITVLKKIQVETYLQAVKLFDIFVVHSQINICNSSSKFLKTKIILKVT